jgi:hypothetical protein
MMLWTLNARGDDTPELDGEVAGNSPLLILKPEAAKLGAPEWTKPGVRISYLVRSATVPESSYGLTEADNGEWEDPITGKKYKKEETVGGGGEGFAQLDIVAVGKTAVAVQGAMYLIAQPTQPPTLLKFLDNGFIGAAAGPADYWVHPKLLADATQMHSPKFFVLKGNYNLEGKPIPSLCIVTREPDFYSSQAYDLKTGLLISSTINSRGKLAAVKLPGEDAVRGNKSITTLRLISVRQLKGPGVDGKNPDWVARIKRMQYAGTVTVQIPGVPPVQGPAQLDVAIGKRGTNWARYTTDLQFNIGGMPQRAPGDGVVSLRGGSFWVDPVAFAKVEAGQVLDEDPVTRIKTSIGQVDRGNRFTVLVQGPGVASESMYDARTGMLQAFNVVVPSSHMTFSFRLQGSE